MSNQSAQPDLSLEHLVRPPRTSSAGRPPLLIQLHGIGSNERDLFGFAELLDPRFLVVSVRAPLLVGADNYAWFEVEYLPQGFVIHAEQFRASYETFVRFLGEVTAAYQADPERVYLIGFSQGASMSLAVTLSHPELVAGASILSGRLLPEGRPWFASSEQLAGLPLLVTHGTEDVVIPIRYAQQTRQALIDLPVSLTYREYPMGHAVSAVALRDVRIWLTARLNGPRRVK